MRMTDRFRPLKARMVERGISQADVAERCRKSPGYVSQRFTGLHPFTAVDMLALKDLLHLDDPHDFLTLLFPGARWEPTSKEV